MGVAIDSDPGDERVARGQLGDRRLTANGAGTAQVCDLASTQRCRLLQTRAPPDRLACR